MSSGAIEDWRADAPVICTIGIAHAGSHFFHLILPPLFPFIITDTGISIVELGLAMSVFFAVSGLLQIVAGFCVDHLGAERILIAGLTFLGCGALLAATSSSLPQLLAATVLLGIGNSVFHPADYAILGHHITPNRLGRAFGVHTIGGSIGWAAAPPLMTGLALALDWQTALIVASIAGFAIALLVLLMRQRLKIELSEQQRSGKRIDLSFLRERAILMCFLFFTAQAFVIMALQGFMPLALGELYGVGLTTAAWMLTVFLLGSSLGTLLGGIVADRQNDQEWILVGGYGLGALCLLLAGLVAMPEPLLFLTLAMAGAAKGFTTPSRDLLIRKVAGPLRAGAVFGVVYSGLDLGGTIAPYLTALVFETGRPEWFFPLTAMVTALTIATVLGARPAPKD